LAGAAQAASWAEEIIEAARVIEHRRLAQLYVMAAQCYAAGRIDDAVDYAEAGLAVLERGGFDQVPHEGLVWLGGAYLAKGRPERWVEVCRNVLAQSPSTHAFARACLAVALTMTGANDEAMAASECLLAGADASRNPQVMTYARLAYGMVYQNVDPVAAYEAHRQGLKIAQDSGNRFAESYHAGNLARLAVTHAEPVEAFDYIDLAIRNFYDSGSFSILPSSLAILATLLDRLGHYEPAATISGCAGTAFTRTTYPEFNSTITHLRRFSAVMPTNHWLAQAKTRPAPRWRPTRSSRSTRHGPISCGWTSPHERRHVPIHRHRGIDAALGGRRGFDAGRAGGAQRSSALVHRSARGPGLQLHRRRHVCGVRLTTRGG
jgi:tetratricopeptide (TPR) repeat protein